MPRITRLLLALLALTLLAACGTEAADEVTVADEPEEAADSDAPEEDADDADEADESEAAGASADGESVEEGPDEADDPERISEGDVGPQEIDVYAIREVEGRLWVESVTHQVPADEEAVATAAMERLFGAAPEDPGLRAPAGTDVEVLGVEVYHGTLSVDVSDDIYDAATGAEGEEAFRQALAHTGAQFDTVEAVELQVEGERVTELWGHVDWSDLAAPDAYARSPIDVDRPTHGETWPPGPITVTGTSLTYESTVELDLIDPDGNVVEETFTTAEQPAVDVRGPFEHTFDTQADEPGTWTIRVRAPDPSGGEEGGPQFVAEVELKVE